MLNVDASFLGPWRAKNREQHDFHGPYQEFRLPEAMAYLNNSGHSRQHLFHTMM